MILVFAIMASILCGRIHFPSPCFFFLIESYKLEDKQVKRKSSIYYQIHGIKLTSCACNGESLLQ
jgi:hypothetical protein